MSRKIDTNLIILKQCIEILESKSVYNERLRDLVLRWMKNTREPNFKSRK